MKSLVRAASALFFAAAILFATTQPAGAAFSWYDWTGVGDQVVHDSRDLSLTKGQDIRNAFYAVDDGYRYFRMELYGSPNKGANGFANLYGFFIQKGEGNKYNTDPDFSTPLGFNVDSYLGAYVKPKLGGGLKFTPDGGTYIGATEYAFSQLKYERNGKYLDWAIPEGDLPDNFTWLAATLNKGSWVVLNQTVSVATPIPSAALLLGTGIIGLIGLRRRSVRKA